MAGVVHVPFYATGFRSDGLEAELIEIAQVSLRYGGTGYRVYRYRDDRYKFLLEVGFEDKVEWERFWEGPEATFFRTKCSGWYQVPVLYGWVDVVGAGAMPAQLEAVGEAPNGG